MIAHGRDKPTVLSAFTGAGGLDLGLEAAGFRTLACIEYDDLARRTLRANRPRWRLLEPGDITALALRLTPALLGLHRGELAVLAGGPPCQPFSKAAQWSATGLAGMRDDRSKCISSFIDLIETFLPRVMLIENVVGFVKGRTSVVPALECTLASINERCGTEYRLQSHVLNAVDYGVPQRRERAILIALRDNETFTWPKPTHCGRAVRTWDAIGGLKVKKSPACHGKWADLLPSIPEGQNYLWHTDRGGGLPLFGYRTRYWSFLLKLAKSEPAWTLPAQPGPATGPFHWDHRPLAIEEMLRLQTFPASWEVVGNYRAQLRQVGNATPPLLAEVIARAIGSQVFGMKYHGTLRRAIRRRRKVPKARPRRPVPHRYLALRGIHAAHPGTGNGPKPVKRKEAG